MPHFTARDGARVHYLDIGRGPACLMLHAFGMRASMWLPFVLPHAHRQRFLMLDFRGFGGSRGVAITSPNVLRQFAEDAEDLLIHAGIPKAALVGFSIGAATGFEYLRQFGDARITRYLHIDQTPCIANQQDWEHGLLGPEHEPTFARVREVLAAFAGVPRDLPFRSLPRDLRHLYFSWFGEFFANCLDTAWGEWVFRKAGPWNPGRVLLKGDDWGIYLDCVQAFLEQDYDFRQSLRSVKVPLWVLIGGRSKIYPAEGQRAIADYAPHARLIEFSGVGHVLPMEAPVRFVRTLGDFIAGSPEFPLEAKAA